MIGNGTVGSGVLNALGGPNPKTHNAVVLNATSGITNYTDAQNVMIVRLSNFLFNLLAFTAAAKAISGTHCSGYRFFKMARHAR